MDEFKLVASVVSALFWSAWLAAFLGANGVHPLRALLGEFSSLGWLRRVAVLFLVVQLTLFAGAKHGTNDVIAVSVTNCVTGISGMTNGVDLVVEANVTGDAILAAPRALRAVAPSATAHSSAAVAGARMTPSPAAVAPMAMRLAGSSLTDGMTGLAGDADVLHGYRLESVSINDAISYDMPDGASVRGAWHLTGAYEDVQKVSLGDFRFPLGTNLCSSLWTYTWGKVRPQLKNTVNEIAAVGAPMSAIPDTSRFWTLLTANDTYLMTWENFAPGRVSGEGQVSGAIAPAIGEALPVSSPLQNGIAPPLTSGEDTASPFLSAQIEFFRNGDFVTRSNNVECVYRRVIEPNPIGPGNPEDPGNPGMPVCPYGPVQDLSVINETNAYCWVDIVVNDADAWVRFEGDGPSNLADPSFAAKAGETNHVVILIGKTYKVTCDVPFAVVDKSSPAIDERWEDDRTVWLNWPVVITALEDGVGPRLLSAGLRLTGAGSSGKGFAMCVVPDGLGGSFSWTNSCCSVSGSGTHFSYSCGGQCFCAGCAAKGYYCYEGYRIGCKGGWCGCSSVPGEWEGNDDPYDSDPAPSVSVRFEDRAVIFEDAYENRPGNVVPWQSTTTTLHLEVHGGMKGGTATFSFENRDKLVGFDIPTSLDVPAGHCMSYQFTYSGKSPSGSEDDIKVHGEFEENNAEEGSEPLVSDTELTCVKVELEAVYEAPENPCQSRHTYGVGEKVKFKVSPQEESIKLKTEKLDTDDTEFGYELFEGKVEVDASSIREYVCPISASYTPPIRVTLGGVEYRPSLSLVEPEQVITPEAGFQGCHPSGDVGQSTLVTTSYIGPMTVSFQGIMVAEIPCEDEIPPSGYFATTNFTGFRSHTADVDDDGKRGAGAGIAHQIKPGNYWTVDEAGGGLYPNWSPGRLEWKIPIGWVRLRSGYQSWRVKEAEYERYGVKSSRPLLIGGRTDKYKQVFTIEEDGTSKVEKFGHWLSRGRYCKIILDGVLKKWNHWF